MSRRPLDFYETAPWQTRALLAHQPIRGTVLEPCSGDGSIVNILRAQQDIDVVVTNDIDPDKKADFHLNAARPELYEQVPSIDWVITNPPFTMPTCTEIVELAVKHARVGVAMMLRLSFREPTAKVNPRGPFLAANPPSRLLTLPRYSFTGNGKSDSMTTEWVIWLKGQRYGAVLSIHNADIRYSE